MFVPGIPLSEGETKPLRTERARKRRVAVSPQAPMMNDPPGEWRNGRRTGLRILWGIPCGFKSRLAHGRQGSCEVSLHTSIWNLLR